MQQRFKQSNKRWIKVKICYELDISSHSFYLFVCMYSFFLSSSLPFPVFYGVWHVRYCKIIKITAEVLAPDFLSILLLQRIFIVIKHSWFNLCSIMLKAIITWRSYIKTSFIYVFFFFCAWYVVNRITVHYHLHIQNCKVFSPHLFLNRLAISKQYHPAFSCNNDYPITHAY